MKSSTARLTLLSSASTAAALLLLPTGAQAQSTTCSQVATTITCVDGTSTVLTATTTAGTTTVAGPGLVTANTTTPSTTTYVATGPISTTAVSGVTLTSTGGALTFTPSGTTAPVNITTIGGNAANGLTLNTAGQAATVTVGNIATTGTNSFGVLSTGGTDLTLKTGNITTTGATSDGLFALNQTGNVSITAGNISTTGNGLATITSNSSTNTVSVGNVTSGRPGIFAQGGTVTVTAGNVTTSTNGGTTTGGYGVGAQAFNGDVNVSTGAVSTVNGTGIFAIALNATGSSSVSGCPSVSTIGNNAPAINASSSGTGSITIKCGAITTTGDMSYGAVAVANGGNVLVNTTSVTTAGMNAVGEAALTSGTGTVTTNAGTITTTGLGATGLIIRAGTGAIDAGYGNITTSGLNNSGVFFGFSGSALDIASTGTINLRGAGATLRTNGAGVTAAIVNGAGVTGNLGNVTTTGVGAQGAIITSTAPVNLIVGNVATTGNSLTVNAGANAVTLTTGTVTATDVGATGTVINSTGAVTFTGGKQTANGANAFRIAGGAGAINATVNGAATTGVGTAVAITGTGPLTFANTGSITTTGATSSGISISGVTTAAVTCGNVSTTGANSPAVVVAANGTTNVTCGTVTTTGAASDGIVVRNTAGTTTVTGGTTSATGAGSAGIVVLSSAPAATGLVTVNSGTVTANGNAVVGRSFGGADVIVNATGNVTSTTGTGITAGTGGTTLVTIGAGTTTTGVQGVSLLGVTSNTLIVNGTLKNTGGTTPYSVLNGGPFTLTLGPNGTIIGPLVFTFGNDTFNNQGTYALPATIDFDGGTNVINNSGTLTAFTGTSNIYNLQTFNNAGGLIDMRNGVANNVVNLRDSNYVATGNARLGIDVVGTGGLNTTDRLVIGGTTSGTTTVLANFINPVIDTTGAIFVDSTNNNLAAGQFVLSGQTNFGLINYGIQVRGGDAFIVSTPDARIFDTVFIGRQMRDLWYQSADAYNSYATARRISYGQERSHPLGIWAQLYGDRQTSGDRNRTTSVFGTSLNVADRMRTEFRGAQGGLDFGAANFVFGVTGGYERAQGTSDTLSSIRTEGHNYGAYVQFGMTTGIYAGALVKRDDYRTVYSNGAIQNGFAELRSHSTGVEGEVGLRTGGAGNINFDIGAGLAYVRYNVGTFNFGNVNFDDNDVNSFRGRAHVRATFAAPIAPFIEARVFHEFRDNNSYTLRSGSSSSILDGASRGTYVRLEGGIGGGTQGGPLLSVWADVGDTQGFGLRAGFRF